LPDSTGRVPLVCEPEVNAVNRIFALATVVLLLALPGPSFAQSDVDGLRSQFEDVIAGLNNNSFKQFHAAIDADAFLGRIYGAHVIDEDVRRAVTEVDFRTMLEKTFLASFPAPYAQDQVGGDIVGTIISFTEEGGQARATVRFEAKGFRFSYHVYDLVRGRRGRVQIIDWFDYYQSSWFSDAIGAALVHVMPDAVSVSAILELPNPTRAQLFQAGELFKAAREPNPKRFFEIYDGIDEEVRNDPYVVVLNFQYCRGVRNYDRLEAAAGNLAATFPGDAQHSLSLAEFYVQRRRFEEAIAEFGQLQAALGTNDGVIESLKATSAMALGEFERAQAFALSATQVEPGLELGWWTLLRTRTAAEDFEGATEALTMLEERFGHLLIPEKLRRDPFLRVLIKRQEYMDWRKARDQAS